MPAVTWASSTDQTDPLLAIKCDRVDHLTIQSSQRVFAQWLKIAQLIEDIPII
jgi:hypothetical protein